jgi:hypothetical protein
MNSTPEDPRSTATNTNNEEEISHLTCIYFLLNFPIAIDLWSRIYIH